MRYLCGSPSIAVKVTGEGMLHAMPCFARRRLSLFPFEAALAFGTVPAALQLRLDVVEALIGIPAAAFPAVGSGASPARSAQRKTVVGEDAAA